MLLIFEIWFDVKEFQIYQGTSAGYGFVLEGKDGCQWGLNAAIYKKSSHAGILSAGRLL
jgi:hypothetical protein